jgi:hypothetical protein
VLSGTSIKKLRNIAIPFLCLDMFPSCLVF